MKTYWKITYIENGNETIAHFDNSEEWALKIYNEYLLDQTKENVQLEIIERQSFYPSEI